MDAEDSMNIVKSLAKNSLHKNVSTLIWTFLKQNWKAFDENLDTETLKVKISNEFIYFFFKDVFCFIFSFKEIISSFSNESLFNDVKVMDFYLKNEIFKIKAFFKFEILLLFSNKKEFLQEPDVHLRQAMEQVEANIFFVGTQEDELKRFFKDFLSITS